MNIVRKVRAVEKLFKTLEKDILELKEKRVCIVSIIVLNTAPLQILQLRLLSFIH